MTERRELFRIGIHRKGFLHRRGETMVCEIYDLTEEGLQIVTDLPLAVGETVALEFQLVDHVVIHCALLIPHVHGRSSGGRIIQISTEHQQALADFIGELIAGNLVSPGQGEGPNSPSPTC